LKAQHLIKAIILGTQVVGRAFAKAVRNEFARKNFSKMFKWRLK
jgi:hypothetical protein